MKTNTAMILTVTGLLLMGAFLYQTLATSRGDQQLVSLKSELRFADRQDFEAYIQEQTSALEAIADSQGERDIPVSITFTSPLGQAELDQLSDKFGLYIEYFEFLGSGNIRGGRSTRVARDLSFVEEELREADPGFEMFGIVYVVASGAAEKLVDLQGDSRVVLVDIGRLLESDELRSQGANVVIHPAPNLHDWYQRFVGG